MNNRSTSVALVCLLVTAGFIGFITFESEVVSASKTIYVGSGSGNDTTSIQDATGNLASPGDTVFVYSGVYVGGLWINKTLNLVGEDRNTTIIDGMGGYVVWISSTEWVNVTGFTLTNGSTGFNVISSSYCTFIDNIVHDINGHGFFFTNCPYSNNKIIGNVVYNNEFDGIHLEDESTIDELTFWNNTIINNTVYNNTDDGIFVNYGENNFIIDNIVHHNALGSINPKGGIRIVRSPNNVIIGNTVHDNDNGIHLRHEWYKVSTSNNIISGNKVYNNDEGGINLINASDNTLTDNLIFDNNFSLYMSSQANGNDFINCSLSNATISNVYMESSSDNNFINCTLTNTSTNVYIEQKCRDNYFINCTLSNASKDDFNLTEDSHAISCACDLLQRNLCEQCPDLGQ
jgi:parallel beta-helix repeat protein